MKREGLLCNECGHDVALHEPRYGCDYEADRPDPDIGPVAWRCGCKAWSYEALAEPESSK